MVIFVKKMTTTHEVLMNTAKINKFVNNCTDKHGFFLCYATPCRGSYVSGVFISRGLHPCWCFTNLQGFTPLPVICQSYGLVTHGTPNGGETIQAGGVSPCPLYAKHKKTWRCHVFFIPKSEILIPN